MACEADGPAEGCWLKDGPAEECWLKEGPADARWLKEGPGKKGLPAGSSAVSSSSSSGMESSDDSSGGAWSLHGWPQLRHLSPVFLSTKSGQRHAFPASVMWKHGWAVRAMALRDRFAPPEPPRLERRRVARGLRYMANQGVGGGGCWCSKAEVGSRE